MAISPTKPDMIDVTSKGKILTWFTPTLSVGGDTITVPFKRVSRIYVGNRPTTTYTSSAAAGGGTVLTVTVTASCTGAATTPISIYGFY